MTGESVLLLSQRFLFGKRGEGRDSSAKKSLRGAIMGIALSIVPLVVVLQLADGMIEGIMRRFIELGTYQAQARPQRAQSADDLRDFAAGVAEIPGVKAVYPELQGSGVAISAKLRTGAQVRAVDPELFLKNKAFSELLTLHAGSLSLEKRNSALVGSALAKKLNLNPGDRVNLLTLRASPSGALMPRISNFKVEGIISCGYQELDSLWFFIPLSEGYRVLPIDSSIALIGIDTGRIEFPGSRPAGPHSYETIRSKLEPGLAFYPWYELIEAQYQSLRSTKLWLLLITGLIVLVACVNVYQAVVMLVIERRQEIAVLKSLGASAGGITLAFTLCGAFIGFISMSLGMALGIFMAVNINESIHLMESLINWLIYLDSSMRGLALEPIRLLDPQYYLEKIPIRLDFTQLLVAGCATIVMAALAAFIPARKAGAIAPLEVLRKA